MTQELRQLFRNNSNCYADTWIQDGEKLTEGDVVQAMTEDKFVQCVADFISKESDSVPMEKRYEIEKAEQIRVDDERTRIGIELMKNKEL